MDERSEVEKGDEVILPGFRFHPTDEELVGFYLKRKVEQRALAVELIRQLDIYKYDPWDLPKLATTGENEWYFYCPRDRKYRNSTRPNRVTGAGFWKATGTDRPIHSSSQGGSKCIGLKKSLVFYKGRAAKGTKTDWMMHEFRLPSLAPSSLFKNNMIPPNESWAICKIFKKTNSAARRAVSHSWVSPLPDKKKNEPADADLFSISDIISRMTQSEASTHDCLNNLRLQREQLLQNNFMAFPPLDFSSCCKPSAANQMLNLPPMIPGDVESLSTGIDFGGRQQQQCDKLVVDLPMEINANWRREYLSLNKIENMDSLLNYLPPTSFSDEWKQSLLYM